MSDLRSRSLEFLDERRDANGCNQRGTASRKGTQAAERVNADLGHGLHLIEVQWVGLRAGVR